MKEFDKATLDHVNDISNRISLPAAHTSYLKKIRDDFNFYPQTIYDIGACVLHWTVQAKNTWKDSEIILFDATDILEPLYIEKGYKYNLGLIGKESNKTLKFYQNNQMFGGNSYYRENPEFSPAASYLFDDSSIVEMVSKTLDDIVSERSFPKPDMIKMDVQGAEFDVILGAEESLKTCKHVLLELRHVEYNIGSPEKEQVIDFLQSKGFRSVGLFSDNGYDGDYHFVKE